MSGEAQVEITTNTDMLRVIEEVRRTRRPCIVSRDQQPIFARIRGPLRRQGMRISDNDVIIAATAIYHNLGLVTRTIKHFGRVPGVKIH